MAPAFPQLPAAVRPSLTLHVRDERAAALCRNGVSAARSGHGSTRQAVQRTANELIARELAVAQPNPDHRASPYSVLTPKGRKTLARISQAAVQARHEWFSDRDAAGLATAHHEVRRLRDTLRQASAKPSRTTQG